MYKIYAFELIVNDLTNKKSDDVQFFFSNLKPSKAKVNFRPYSKF